MRLPVLKTSRSAKGVMGLTAGPVANGLVHHHWVPTAALQARKVAAQAHDPGNCDWANRDRVIPVLETRTVDPAAAPRAMEVPVDPVRK